MSDPSVQAFIAYGRLMRSLYSFGTRSLPEVRKESARIRRFAGPKKRPLPIRRSGR